ncbi:MAG: hypothetical protein K0S46_2533 [Moraxellaceae bacterium]|jgi:hypothetical protein|nr:hypothetical protein [Moraxellaceae bacterium]
MPEFKMLLPDVERHYVGLMMGVVGRALVSASQVDDVIRKETSAFPEGFILQMKVMPNGADFTAQVQPDGTLKLLKDFTGKPDLCARFKHLSHAFLVLSFQEGTARAFANDRLYVDGDVSHAIRLVRCLSRMEVLILPKLVAERAVKRYPDIALADKLGLATRIYGRVAANFLKGA